MDRNTTKSTIQGQYKRIMPGAHHRHGKHIKFFSIMWFINFYFNRTVVKNLFQAPPSACWQPSCYLLQRTEHIHKGTLSAILVFVPSPSSLADPQCILLKSVRRKVLPALIGRAHHSQSLYNHK
jgi:hypothetical protein